MNLEDVGLTFFVAGQHSRLVVPDACDFHMYYNGEQIARVTTPSWGIVVTFVCGPAMTYVMEQKDKSVVLQPVDVLGAISRLIAGRGVPAGMPPELPADLDELLTSLQSSDTAASRAAAKLDILLCEIQS